MWLEGPPRNTRQKRFQLSAGELGNGKTDLRPAQALIIRILDDLSDERFQVPPERVLGGISAAPRPGWRQLVKDPPRTLRSVHRICLRRLRSARVCSRGVDPAP